MMRSIYEGAVQIDTAKTETTAIPKTSAGVLTLLLVPARIAFVSHDIAW